MRIIIIILHTRIINTKHIYNQFLINYHPLNSRAPRNTIPCSSMLGNKSDDHFQTILNFARKNENDWMHNLEYETIEAFSMFKRIV